jgi:hypothetical protein
MNQDQHDSQSHKDVFFRSHVVELEPKPPMVSTYDEAIWPEYALVFDTETTLDPREQSLLFGMYRVCRSWGGSEYVCVEEGIFHDDNLRPEYLDVITDYVSPPRDSEVMSDDYDDNIHAYTRSQFVESVFFEAVRTRSLIVAFNAPFDISRLAVGRRISRKRAWTLILSQRVSRKTGEIEPNPERPCVRVTSKDSKAGFFSLTKPIRPEEWPSYEEWRDGDKTFHFCCCGESATHRTKDGTFLCADHAKLAKEGGQKVIRIKKISLIFRVLDLHTLAWALFNESYSLKTACKELHTKHQKYDHEPTGTVTIDDLEYARQDVRCTVDVLNCLKEEFSRHRFNEHRTELYPDKAVSPASIGKAYLRAMGITPLKKKFDVPDYIHGIASQAYFGGRAECRIRNTPVPVVLTDFSSQYPTINSLLGNPEVLRAETLSFDDATSEMRNFVEQITLDDCFEQESWQEMKFFARIQPDNDIVPVRAEYNDDGITKNIGVNYFSSTESVWLSGPDVIASKLLTGRVPNIEQAILIVPHGRQKGLRSTNLLGMVQIDPRTDDLFRRMVEQKEVYKESNKALSKFLKICANSTSYGMFFELTPQKKFNPIKVKVFSGEHNHEQSATIIEKPGEWYFPPIAALITGGAHLLLAMLERCITEKGGHYLFCDTDSMCIVASRSGGWVGCSGEPPIKALSWKDVEEIRDRFTSLNCYDRTKVKGSILKIEDVNTHKNRQIDLFGFAISAKRYVLYRHDSSGNIVIVEAKAHGLGYLYPPKEPPEDNPDDIDWILEAWHWVLEGEIANPRPAPEWFSIPAMMRVTVSTPAVLGMLKGFTKPFNFLHVPLMFPTLYPAGKDPSNFGLIMPFSKHRDQWLDTKAIDIHSGKEYAITLLDPEGCTKRIEVKCYGNILGAYREHPEAKFVEHDGSPCDGLTRGLLRRSHVVANRHRYIGKETSRHWEQGDDMSMVDFRCAEYNDGKVVADHETRKRIVEIGIRQVARGTGIVRNTVRLVTRGEPVKPITLAKLIGFIQQQSDK